jgi:hypothetical protein
MRTAVHGDSEPALDNLNSGHRQPCRRHRVQSWLTASESQTRTLSVASRVADLPVGSRGPSSRDSDWEIRVDMDSESLPLTVTALGRPYFGVLPMTSPDNWSRDKGTWKGPDNWSESRDNWTWKDPDNWSRDKWT